MESAARRGGGRCPRVQQRLNGGARTVVFQRHVAGQQLQRHQCRQPESGQTAASGELVATDRAALRHSGRQPGEKAQRHEADEEGEAPSTATAGGTSSDASGGCAGPATACLGPRALGQGHTSPTGAQPAVYDDSVNGGVDARTAASAGQHWQNLSNGCCTDAAAGQRQRAGWHEFRVRAHPAVTIKANTPAPRRRPGYGHGFFRPSAEEPRHLAVRFAKTCTLPTGSDEDEAHVRVQTWGKLARSPIGGMGDLALHAWGRGGGRIIKCALTIGSQPPNRVPSHDSSLATPQRGQVQ
jgi:hypothetical protein